MNEVEIKTVVQNTINEMLRNSMIKYSDVIIYETISERLKEHFIKPDIDIAYALEQIKDNYYYSVISDYYKDNMTLEQIAEEYDVEVSTIVRNKKALCMKIFEIINQ